MMTPISNKLLWRMVFALATLLLPGSAPGQYLGVTCGYDYSNDLRGPNTGMCNTPLFNSMASNPNATWEEWAEELGASGVDFVCPNLRGSYPNTSVNPTNIAPLLSALDRRGLSKRIKIGLFDDNASSWTAQWNAANGRGFGYARPFDIADTNNWKYLWDYNYKKFYETVPDEYRFKLKGRPLIIIWTGNTYFITNMQGNVSKALTYVRQQCQSTFGFNPYIILSGDFLSNDTTCRNAAITDAIENWFTPNSSHSNGYTLATFNNTKIGALCPQFQNPSTLPKTWLDPMHGVSFANDLNRTRGAGALLTLVEGFTDWEEDAACFRVRNLDEAGNVLAYTDTYYDYPSQRINILRQYGNNPFPAELRFEAESCDTFGGAAGGNGKTNYFRNGNIAIEPTGDVGGGYNVGWIQAGQWLEWQDVPIQGGQVQLQARVASPNAGSRLHFVIDGVEYPAVTVPNTGGWQSYATIECGPPQWFAKGTRHRVRLVCDTAGFNLNYWQFQNQIPIGAIVTLKAKANGLWVSASNATLIANAPVPGTAESFLVTDASSLYEHGTVALLSLANGRYVTADTNGTASLAANAAGIGSAQVFLWNDYGDGTVSLRALANSMAVTAENAGALPLVANRLNAGPWETFEATLVASNTLAFVAQPNDAAVRRGITAGALGEVQVVALNASNVPVAGVAVTMAIGSGGSGTLTGNSAVTDASGIAHFTNLAIDKTGAKTLQASSDAFSSCLSASFNVTPGPQTVLMVETQPDGSGQAVAAQNLAAGSPATVYAVARDSDGNFIANVPAAWSLASLSGGVLAGDLAVSGDARSATFTGRRTGSAIIQATTSFSGQSGVQTVVAGPAANLVMVQQPSASARVGVPFAQQPIVKQADAFGNDSASPMTVTETGGAGNVNRNPNGILVLPVNGISTCSGLYVTNLGVNSLTFTAGTASIQSASFTVGIGNAEQLVWTTPPDRATNGFSFGTAPVLQTTDAGGNLTTLGLPAVKYVLVSIYSGNGLLLGTTMTNIGTAGGNGTVTLPNLGLSLPGRFQLIAQDIGNGYHPTNISAAANCQLWLDAADALSLGSIEVGATVSRWNDKSGHANHATGTATRALASGLSATSPGRAQTVHFNGSQELAVNLNSLSNSPYTILVMEVGASKASGSSYFIGNHGGFSRDLTLGIGYQTATQFRWQQYADDLNYNAAFSSVMARQWTMNLSGAPSITKRLYLNSTLVGTASSGFLTGPNLVNGAVGYNSYLGDVAEIIVYNSSLDLNDQTNLQNYLANKWLTGLSPAITGPFDVITPVYYPSFSQSAGVKSNGVLAAIAFAGVNGPPNGSYRVLSSTNIAAPASEWMPVLTNAFDGSGAFNSTVPIDPGATGRFYRLAVP